MKTPRFWFRHSVWSEVLRPLGELYALATRLRFRYTKPYKVACPVICVGNLTAGGTGKTPVSMALADMLQEMGYAPFFLTRGYGGRLKGVRVDLNIHQAFDVGDEPLLLAQKAPVIVNSDRAAGAQKAVAEGADCLIMDDGFQNPGLAKDVSFLVFDGQTGIGNGYILPAGPLRESFRSGMARAQAVIIIGEDVHNLAAQTDLPVFRADIRPVAPTDCVKGVFAFAGIGRPQKLYQSLTACGLKVVRTKDFPDHHAYTRAELEQLIDSARAENLDLYTTSKDYVKIPVDLASVFHVLNVGIVWRNPQEPKEFLHRQLKRVSR